MQQKPLSAVTESDRVLALQRLIDRQLLKAQMGECRTTCSPRATNCSKTSPNCGRKSPMATTTLSWRKLLASYGLSEEVAEAAPARLSFR